MTFNERKNLGVSLTEVLIVFSIIALFLITAYFLFFRQIFKAQDGKRRADLHELTILLEDYYNDTGCYPLPEEVCYDSPVEGETNNFFCHICGSEPESPEFRFRLPCNPDHPEKKYLYEVEASDCPQWYRIYTELADSDDSGPCPYSLCGPEGGYDYGVSSPNVGLVLKDRDLFGYEIMDNDCGVCSDLDFCQQELKRGNISKIYATQEKCCEDNRYADSCVHHGYDGNDCTTCYGTLSGCIKTEDNPGGLERVYFIDPWLENCCRDNPTAPSCN